MIEARPSLTPALGRRLAEVRTAFGDDPFTHRQARDARIDSKDLRRLVQAGFLVGPVRGVYCGASGFDAGQVEDRARLLSLVLPEGGAIGRRSAAWLWGVDPRSPDERHLPLDVECMVPRDRHPLHRPGVRSFQADLQPEDLVSVAGVPCTTPLRTAVDLLRWGRPHMSLAIVDALAGRTDVRDQSLLECLARWPGERNVRRARQLAEWVEPASESFGESWLRLRLLEAGFPRPMPQIPVPDDRGRVLYRLDLGWPDRKLAVEYDGLEHHSGRAAELADLRRRRDLAVRFGWHVVGVGKGEVLGASLRLEQGVGELLGMQPTIIRRLW